MKVLKFGGSCLATPTSLERVREIVAAEKPPLVLDFSALQGVTDRLLDMARRALLGEVDVQPLLGVPAAFLERLPAPRRRAAEAKLESLLQEELRRTLLGISYLQEVSPRVRDRVAGQGELAACVLAEALLAEAGLPVHAVSGAGDHGLVTDSQFGDARILDEPSLEKVRARFGGIGSSQAPPPHPGPVPAGAREKSIAIVPGFVGRDARGAQTTLGRGGSDTTATYIGAALGCDTVLFKDTEGLLTADPKIVPEARAIARLHYLDALELAHYGTKAIAEKAILPAMRARTRIEIRGFLRPAIHSTIEDGEADVLAITCVRRAVMADFYGIQGDMLRTLACLFDGLARTHTYPLLLTEASPRGETSIVLKEDDYPRVAELLAEAGGVDPPEVEESLGVVSMIGSHMRGRVGFAASIFQCLAAHGINIVAIAQTASERNVSVIVGRSHVEEAVRALHARFVG